MTTELQRWLSQYDQHEVHKLLVAKATIYHKRVEGEYGCPGPECPGVKRLVMLLEQWTMVLLSLVQPLNREKVEALMKVLDDVLPDMFPDQRARVEHAMKQCRRET